MIYKNYADFRNDIDKTVADVEGFYGNFGFDFAVNWNGNAVQDIEVTWPRQASSYVEDAYRFAEALSALCFELKPFVGAEIIE